MQTTLYYAHDPMCSWCWAYRPTWEHVRSKLPVDINMVPLLGGLAPDSAESMPQPMREKLQEIWRQIQIHVPGTKFNFDFWTRCRPRRSTYPACRAVIAAAAQDQDRYDPMVHAIQRGYYLSAQNPSEDKTLVAMATEIGLDAERFAHDLNSAQTQSELLRQVAFCQQIGLFGFPGLVVQRAQHSLQVQVLMHDPDSQLALIINTAATL